MSGGVDADHGFLVLEQDRRGVSEIDALFTVDDHLAMFFTGQVDQRDGVAARLFFRLGLPVILCRTAGKCAGKQEC